LWSFPDLFDFTLGLAQPPASQFTCEGDYNTGFGPRLPACSPECPVFSFQLPRCARLCVTTLGEPAKRHNSTKFHFSSRRTIQQRRGPCSRAHKSWLRHIVRCLFGFEYVLLRHVAHSLSIFHPNNLLRHSRPGNFSSIYIDHGDR
jgi:hypothetical protein